MNNEMMVTDDNMFALNLTHAKTSYCSFKPKTHEEKIAFFNMVNSPQKRLKEYINMEIELRDIYAEQCEFINQETGEAQPGVRMVLIATDGTSYQAASRGVFTSVQKLISIFGEPSTWKNPVKIRPKELSKGVSRNVLVFELV